MIKRIFSLLVAAIIVFLASCNSVKPYQKAHLNQEDMKLSTRKVETYDNSIESYREGSSGATGGKTGGGCGCN
ncbi:MAG: hypothetical protein CVU11_12980 [Bacteroidetes bacterium HGW-Bacteroidetes-6]|jgi:hypothetical protein|nr:MAG: hypothetical protein CVU11_12980 [Bacteroidetes bacterium HGW-Bacteroidetes-6]